MEISEWFEKYYQKTGEKFRLLPNYTLLINREYGFVTFRICKDILWINQSSNISKYWLPILNSIAKTNGCKYLKAPTTHNPKMFARLFKAKCEYEYTAKDGRKHYIFSKEVE